MALLTASKLASLVGLDPRTVRKKLEDVQSVSGPGGSRLYKSEDVLLLRDPDGEECSPGELRAAKRAESLERREKLAVEVQSLRRERVPLEQVGEAFSAFCQSVRDVVDKSKLKPAEKAAICREIQGILRQW